MNLIKKLQRDLNEARKRENKANRDISAGGLDFRSQEYDDIRAAVLDLERQLASAKGEPYATLSDFPIRWDIGAPLPHLFANDNKAFLTFYANVPDPNWDGTYITVKDPNDDTIESLALVEFLHCDAVKLGSPNDEVLHGHYLHGRGLDSYTAQIVKNSYWIEELRLVNSVHHNFQADRVSAMNHYVFWFHDTTFECLAESYDVKLYQMSMRELATLVVPQLLS